MSARGLVSAFGAALVGLAFWLTVAVLVWPDLYPLLLTAALVLLTLGVYIVVPRAPVPAPAAVVGPVVVPAQPSIVDLTYAEQSRLFEVRR